MKNEATYEFLVNYWNKEDYNKKLSGLDAESFQELVEINENNPELAIECLKDWLAENGDNPDNYVYEIGRVEER